MLKENLREVEGRIEAACKRAGRDVTYRRSMMPANVILAKIKYRNCVQRWKLCHRTSSGI